MPIFGYSHFFFIFNHLGHEFLHIQFLYILCKQTSLRIHVRVVTSFMLVVNLPDTNILLYLNLGPAVTTTSRVALQYFLINEIRVKPFALLVW